MAKIICSHSGVEFSCEHLPFPISSREISHPLFSVSSRKLIGLTSSWAAGRLSQTENYLLYLALLNSTSLVEWRVPAIYHDRTPQIIANNMEQLIHIIGRIDAIKHPSFVLPHFVISQDTCSLENSYHWIQAWLQNYNDWRDNVKSHANDQELTRRENSLNKLIKTSHKKIEDYPRVLAQWARIAADFPLRMVKVRGIKMELADYWEEIIIKCANDESAFHINAADLQELYDHCEDELIAPVDRDGNYTIGEGSLYATTLMRYLRKGIQRQQNYLGDLGDSISGGLTAYRILSPETSASDANIQAMIDAAPDKEPQKRDYPSLIAYLKAKSRWLQKENFVVGKAIDEETNKPPENPSTDIGDNI